MCQSLYLCGHVCVYIGGIYFKQLAHAIVRTSKSDICISDWKARDPGRVGAPILNPKVAWSQNSLMFSFKDFN